MADRPLAEHVCLVLVVQGASHGWAVGSLLVPGAEVGRVWSLSRPLTYRALDALVADGLVEQRGTAPGRGKARTLLGATARGRRAATAWLARPVDHVRDVRTELLLKLVLLERAGRPTGPLLRAQLDAFAPIVAALDTREPADPVELWRREVARSVRRFLDEALTRAEGREPGSPPG